MQSTAHQTWHDTLQGPLTLPNPVNPEGPPYKLPLTGNTSGPFLASNIMPYDDGSLILANNSFRPSSQLRHRFEHGDFSPSNNLAWSPDSTQSDEASTVRTPVDPYSIPPPLVDMYTNEVCPPARVQTEVDWRVNAQHRRPEPFPVSAQFPHSLHDAKPQVSYTSFPNFESGAFPQRYGVPFQQDQHRGDLQDHASNQVYPTQWSDHPSQWATRGTHIPPQAYAPIFTNPQHLNHGYPHPGQQIPFRRESPPVLHAPRPTKSDKERPPLLLTQPLSSPLKPFVRAQSKTISSSSSSPTSPAVIVPPPTQSLPQIQSSQSHAPYHPPSQQQYATQRQFSQQVHQGDGQRDQPQPQPQPPVHRAAPQAIFRPDWSMNNALKFEPGPSYAELRAQSQSTITPQQYTVPPYDPSLPISSLRKRSAPDAEEKIMAPLVPRSWSTPNGALGLATGGTTGDYFPDDLRVKRRKVEGGSTEDSVPAWVNAVAQAGPYLSTPNYETPSDEGDDEDAEGEDDDEDAEGEDDPEEAPPSYDANPSRGSDNRWNTVVRNKPGTGSYATDYDHGALSAAATAAGYAPLTKI